MSVFFAHVYLLSLAWLLIAPVAMFVGTQPLRRQLFPQDHNSSVRHTRAHRWAMIILFLMVSVGSFLGMFGLHHGPTKSMHGMIGITAYVLLCILVLLGVLRAHVVKPLGPRNTVQRVFTRRKHLITAIHKHLGISLWTLAAINVLLGLLKIHAHYAHLAVVGTYAVLWFAVLTYQVYFKRSLSNIIQKMQPSQPDILPPTSNVNRLSSINLTEKIEENNTSVPI